MLGLVVHVYLLLTLFANMLDSASGVLGCFLNVAPGRSGLVVSLGYSVNVGMLPNLE